MNDPAGPLIISVVALDPLALASGNVNVTLRPADRTFSYLRLVDGVGALHDYVISLADLRALGQEIVRHVRAELASHVPLPRPHAATGKRA